jgi:chromosomal replication initiation ATPase DnaA
MRESIQMPGKRHEAAGQLAPKSRLRVARLRRDQEAFELVVHIAASRGVRMQDLVQGSRGTGASSQARQLAMYLVHVLLGRPQDVVAALFGRERTTVCHTCRSIELRRDDPALEAEILRIEAAMAERHEGSRNAA